MNTTLTHHLGHRLSVCHDRAVRHGRRAAFHHDRDRQSRHVRRGNRLQVTVISLGNKASSTHLGHRQSHPDHRHVRRGSRLQVTVISLSNKASSAHLDHRQNHLVSHESPRCRHGYHLCRGMDASFIEIRRPLVPNPKKRSDSFRRSFKFLSNFWLDCLCAVRSTALHATAQSTQYAHIRFASFSLHSLLKMS